ncbi:MAG: hypothetical protein CO113_17120 [Elusimicrobia bacterium CG_4_9_14_3_um_filter_62_55]|nr:MAG: hypothetical protein CO113_17120 [Elusimicrobia bacterium CG_4_9_14_3_um_filter_62_55]
MKRKPLYLIPLLAFALVMPSALTPPAAFADSPTSTPNYLADAAPANGEWTKITMTSNASLHEAPVYFVPGPLSAKPRGTYRKLYLAPDLTKSAFSYLWHDGRVWQINWFRKGGARSGHDHVSVADATVKTETVVIKRDPSAGIPPEIWAAVNAASPGASIEEKQKAARALSGAVARTGPVIGAELVNEIKKRGPAGVSWAAGLYASNGGNAELAGASLIKSFAKGNDDLAKRVAEAVSSDPGLKELLSKVNAGTVPPVVGGDTGVVVKNEFGKAIENAFDKAKESGDVDGGEIADVLTGFMFEKWEGGKRSFVPEADADKIKPEKVKPIVADFVGELLADSAKRHNVFVLYTGLRTGAEPPEWAKKIAKDDPVAAALLDDDIRKQFPGLPEFKDTLRACMAHWTGAELEGKPDLSLCYDPGANVRVDGSVENTRDFVLEAMTHGRKILDAVKGDLEKLREEIGRARDTTGKPNDETGDEERQGDRDGALNNQAFFDIADLFGRYGDQFLRDGNPKALNNVFRIDGVEFALVVRSIPKEIKGPDGKVRQVLTNQIGVYNTSQGYNIVGKRFDFNDAGDHTFTLPGSDVPYTLTIPADRNKPLGFKAAKLGKGDTGKLDIPGPNEKGGYPDIGSGMSWIVKNELKPEELPSMSDLFIARSQKAVSRGHDVTIDGKTFKVTGESANTGNLLYWDPDDLERMSKGEGEPWLYKPKMVARVNKKGAQGELEQVSDPNNPGKTALGQIGDQWYGLQWVATSDGQGYYKTVKLEKEPAPEAPPAEDKPAGDDSQRGTTGDQQRVATPDAQGGFDVAQFNDKIPAGHRITSGKRVKGGHFQLISEPGGRGILMEVGQGDGNADEQNADLRKRFIMLRYVTANDNAKVVKATMTASGYFMTKDDKGGYRFMDFSKPASPQKGGFGAPPSTHFIKSADGRVELMSSLVGKELLRDVLAAGVFQDGRKLEALLKQATGNAFENFLNINPEALLRKKGTGSESCPIKHEGSEWKIGDCTPAGSTVPDDREGVAGSIAMGDVLPGAVADDPVFQKAPAFDGYVRFEHSDTKAGGIYYKAKDKDNPNPDLKILVVYAEDPKQPDIEKRSSKKAWAEQRTHDLRTILVAHPVSKKTAWTAGDFSAFHFNDRLVYPVAINLKSGAAPGSFDFAPSSVNSADKGAVFVSITPPGETKAQLIGWLATWGGPNPKTDLKGFQSAFPLPGGLEWPKS